MPCPICVTVAIKRSPEASAGPPGVGLEDDRHPVAGRGVADGAQPANMFKEDHMKSLSEEKINYQLIIKSASFSLQFGDLCFKPRYSTD